MGGFPPQSDLAQPARSAAYTDLAFTKYEGLGNDFVVVEVEDEDEIDADLAVQLCDRRYGVGADGVLVVLPAEHPAHAGRMRVINADGSVPEMCGNGLRCVALHLAARAAAVGAWRGSVETDAGVRACNLHGEGDEATVEVDMGRVRVLGERALEVGGVRLLLHLADAGNPHAIVFGHPAGDAAASRAEMERLGAIAAVDPSFANGTNVEFVASLPDDPAGFDVFVWERGVGPTLACGTGACAVAAVAVALGKAPKGSPVRVRLPGGDLAITIDEAGRARMLGPARRVFRGVVARGAARREAAC